MTARDDILGRLDSLATPGDPVAAYAALERPYLTAHHGDGLVELFVARVAHYKAAVRRVAAGELAAAVAAALDRPGRYAVPAGLPAAWLAAVDPARLEHAPGTDPAALDGLAGVVTGCAAAIAETGTIVLDHGPGQGARALTLVPDHHVVVVAEGRIAADVPGGLARLDPARPLTLVSGPSATSDIELSRVEGVHGPRRLDVLVVP